jgi:ribulose-5-phosphate 4-epimerase/fuculose-1-phosphate aldolase
MSAVVAPKQSRSKEQQGFDPEEWKLRCDLAAAYQLIDLYGMSDLAATHISARLPGPDNHFLLNPMGILFDQITASSLITVDIDGRVVAGDARQLNPAGFVIHSAIHMARPDLICALHTHTRANNGVGAVSEGLLPLTQRACALMHFLRYHDYEGIALGSDERERIVRDLGDEGRAMILRNHGALTVGRSIGEAWIWTYRLEIACRFQIDAMTCAGGGLTLNTLARETVEKTIEQGRQNSLPGGIVPAEDQLEWPSLLRRLERERGASYRT